MNTLKKFYQTKIFDIGSLAAGATVNQPANLETSYNRCIGTQVQLLAAGGDANLRIGISKAGNSIHEPSNVKNWVTGENVGHSERVKEHDFSVSANDVKMVFEASATITNAKVEILFILEEAENI
jgi:hypothetical protein